MEIVQLDALCSPLSVPLCVVCALYTCLLIAFNSFFCLLEGQFTRLMSCCEGLGLQQMCTKARWPITCTSNVNCEMALSYFNKGYMCLNVMSCLVGMCSAFWKLNCKTDPLVCRRTVLTQVQREAAAYSKRGNPLYPCSGFFMLHMGEQPENSKVLKQRFLWNRPNTKCFCSYRVLFRVPLRKPRAKWAYSQLGWILG